MICYVQFYPYPGAERQMAEVEVEHQLDVSGEVRRRYPQARITHIRCTGRSTKRRRSTGYVAAKIRANTARRNRDDW